MPLCTLKLWKEEAIQPRPAPYALPDHEVVLALVPDAGSTHLDHDEAARKIAGDRTIVPLAIDHRGGGRIFWASLGQRPFKEWQYIFTIQQLAEAGELGSVFSSDLSILDEDALFSDSIYPSAFIHHISRCGSTLTAKALARPADHMMVSQGAPLQRGFWAWATADWQTPIEASEIVLRRLKNLVLAMTRRRLGGEQRAFIKFISWNILYVDIIAAAFPDVPGLFLYRDPVEVIASVKKETTAALVAQGTDQGAFLSGLSKDVSANLDETDYLAACYAHYFQSALDSRARLAFVNYRDLSRDTFVDIVERGLGLKLSDEEQLAMLEQFRYHSKDDSKRRVFQDDSADKRAALTESERDFIEKRCSGLISRLDMCARNLFHNKCLEKAGTSAQTFAGPHQ